MKQSAQVFGINFLITTQMHESKVTCPLLSTYSLFYWRYSCPKFMARGRFLMTLKPRSNDGAVSLFLPPD